MSAENSFEYGQFKLKLLKSSSGLKEVDLGSASIATFSLYEDIMSPTMTAKLTFAVVDVLGSKGLELYGGEELIGSIRVTNFPESEIRVSFRIKNMHFLKESNKTVYHLELISYEALQNEVLRIVKRFDGDIGKSVSTIFKSFNSNKTLKTETTYNKYSFIGNNKRPFDLFTFLAPKAVSSGEKKSAGYLFFETQDGFTFKSINTLLKGTNNTIVYTKDEAKVEQNEGNKYRILSAFIEKNNDILNSLRLGMYSNVSFFYNLYTNDVKFVDYKLKEKYNKEIETSAQKLTESYPPLPGNVQNFPSRYYLRTLDVGNLDKTGKLSSDTMYPDLPKYQAEAVVRYNLLNSQILKIMIPCNPSLRAGQVIECRIPESASTLTDKSYQSQNTGRYMISSLCHLFSGKECYTSLELVRDSYEIKTQIA